jgi:putative colanic acid biosynthesis glycosyltransferase
VVTPYNGGEANTKLVAAANEKEFGPIRLTMSDPLITVITVTYNAAPTLEATIESVLSQDRTLFEYWIIDGGSTDGTVDIIRRYDQALTGWISEPDSGIYEAMNKGVDRSKGQWLYFLGADDFLCMNSLSKAKPYLTEDYVCVYGDITFKNGRVVNSFFSLRTLLQNTIHHQATFYRKTLFFDFRYDTKLLILSDYELNIKIYKLKLRSQKMPVVIANCGMDGASSNLALSLKETNYIRKKYVIGRVINAGLSQALRLYYMQKRIRKYLFS